jgi:hypothetical protein
VRAVLLCDTTGTVPPHAGEEYLFTSAVLAMSLLLLCLVSSPE